MLNKIKLSDLEDYFKESDFRNPKGVYVYRIVDYNNEIEKFLYKYLEYVKQSGVYIKNYLQNPTQDNINFFHENIGNNFQMDISFIRDVMRNWLKQITTSQVEMISEAIYDALKSLEKEGKNLSIIKNSYIKYMCWLYYRFQSVLKDLGKNQIPKLLFDGNATNHELKILDIIAKAGCDVLIIYSHGEKEYLKIDKNSSYSYIFINKNPKPFPNGFSISTINAFVPKVDSRLETRKKIEVDSNHVVISTNTWLSGDVFSDSLKKIEDRGKERKIYYNMFVKVKGVNDKNSYLGDLLKWKMKLDNMKITSLIIENGIKNPDISEVKMVKKKNYSDSLELIEDLSRNISYSFFKDFEILLRRAFKEIILEQSTDTIQRLVNKAVIFICWINRYVPLLIKKDNRENYPTLIYYGEFTHENEKLFLRMLVRTPIDVIILCPDKSKEIKITDRIIFNKIYNQSLVYKNFPKNLEEIRLGTVASNAEKDLDTILYGGTGLFRQHQYKSAIPITLETNYEEIGIIWEQDAMLRHGFEILADKVMVPVICSKLSGIPNRDEFAYWVEIEKLIQTESIYIQELPFAKNKKINNSIKTVVSFIHNNKIDVNRIKRHDSFKYGFIREEMQDYIFEKAQQLLNSKIIRGTFINGMEFTILHTILNLDMKIVRLIQRYDFTKQIPKLVIVDTKEEIGTVVDAITVLFLKFLGFDILLFVPTGYRSIDGFFEKKIFIEHTIGDFIYDIDVPEYDKEKKRFNLKKLRFNFKGFFN